MSSVHTWYLEGKRPPDDVYKNTRSKSKRVDEDEDEDATPPSKIDQDDDSSSSSSEAQSDDESLFSTQKLKNEISPRDPQNALKQLNRGPLPTVYYRGGPPPPPTAYYREGPPPPPTAYYREGPPPPPTAFYREGPPPSSYREAQPPPPTQQSMQPPPVHMDRHPFVAFDLDDTLIHMPIFSSEEDYNNFVNAHHLYEKMFHILVKDANQKTRRLVFFVRRGVSRLFNILYEHQIDIGFNSSNLHVRDIVRALQHDTQYAMIFTKRVGRIDPIVTFTDQNPLVKKSFKSMGVNKQNRVSMFAVDDQPQRWKSDEGASLFRIQPFNLRGLIENERAASGGARTEVYQTNMMNEGGVIKQVAKGLFLAMGKPMPYELRDDYRV